MPEQPETKAKSLPLSRKDLVLLLVGLREDGELGDSIAGVTRLQKYLYLLEKEAGLKPDDRGGFAFTAYNYGPYSSKLYDDIEFLENLELVTSRPVAEASELEADAVETLSYEDLIDDGPTDNGKDEGARAADAYQERRFSLTEKGRKRVAELLAKGEIDPAVQSIRKMKGKFSTYSLIDLLHYVYTKHPDSASFSDIKDKVLREGRPR